MAAQAISKPGSRKERLGKIKSKPGRSIVRAERVVTSDTIDRAMTAIEEAIDNASNLFDRLDRNGDEATWEDCQREYRIVLAMERVASLRY